MVANARFLSLPSKLLGFEELQGSFANHTFFGSAEAATLGEAMGDANAGTLQFNDERRYSLMAEIYLM